jgi:hypothetical protein
MGSIYVAPKTAAAETLAQDIFQITAGADNPVLIHGWTLYQTTDVGDAAEEIIQLTCVRGEGSVTAGSGGGALTEVPVLQGGPTATAAVVEGNTTQMVVGTGALVELDYFGWNVRIPWTHFYPPELRPRMNPSDLWTLGMDAAPTDSLTLGGCLYWEEL